MIEGIEALIALDRTGTISKAAAQLRLTQSAVSKRIQSLENELQFKLIEPDGRRVRITAKGVTFLNKARQLISDIKNLKQLEEENEVRKFSIAISDSIAASWGPKLIRLAAKKLKGIDFEIHVHRSTLVEENVKMGRYHLGLCIADEHDSQIVASTIFEEPLIFIRSQSETEKLITIERNSGTWRTLEEKILRHPKLKNYELIYIESFAAIIQMVKEGFGHGLVPLGIAQTMQLNKKDILILAPNIKRQIKLISRKNIAQLPAIEEFQKLLKELSREL